jgi:hypothetical protein
MPRECAGVVCLVAVPMCQCCGGSVNTAQERLLALETTVLMQTYEVW